jgi:hypothetical protein
MVTGLSAAADRAHCVACLGRRIASPIPPNRVFCTHSLPVGPEVGQIAAVPIVSLFMGGEAGHPGGAILSRHVRH